LACNVAETAGRSQKSTFRRSVSTLEDMASGV